VSFIRRFLLFLVVVTALAVVAFSVVNQRTHNRASASTPVGTAGYTLANSPPVSADEVPHLTSLQEEFNRITMAASPSVVSITSTRAEARPELPPGLERFFGRRLPDEVERQAVGSAVIVSEEGHLVTNRHIVAGMDEVEVELSDGRIRQAEVIAMDPVVDMAVLKIEANGLTPLPLGDSNNVRVGDLVMAIGNPLGLAGSVTNGIVSATGRPLQADVDVQYIQTNAEINPGNSGGPLINIRGEIIGINTAIAAVGRAGWMGIGFAIPSNTIRDGLDSVIRHGRIIRGYVGVRLAQLTPTMADRLGMDPVEGLVVVEALPDSPAARAGLRQGDVIVRLDGERTTEPAEFRRRVTSAEVGTEMEVEVLREGQSRHLTIEIGEMPEEAMELELEALPGPGLR
jgi:serine protease Do